ncbi:hypothetical protein F442_21800 [Phytophthora nicotianae P10297]|uniref:BZIP domain-containing protein n=2 Tax=Phytophthora nicotianae TaxID=4792 RepID=W2Y2V8_PHYNI|nr:hypothetical protein L914_21072 [Phytophthora nicotianae]ETP28983.1 hypothetical protein F442_21800 [Phytophthora nicotianae P10297]
MEATTIHRRVFEATIDHPPATSTTIVGPLFKRARFNKVEYDEDRCIYEYDAPVPASPALVTNGYPSRAALSIEPASRGSDSASSSSLLKESLQAALHYNDNSTIPVYDCDSASPDNVFTTHGADGSMIIEKTGGKYIHKRLKTARRREQCRINQARYRLKQDRKSHLLSDTVVKLLEEIPLLEMQRDRILFGAKQSVYNLVVEYFHLFRHGLRTLRQVNRTQIAQGTEAQQQLVFLRYSLSPNVSIGDRYGVDAIVEQWQRYSSYFRDLHFQLEHMDEIVKNLAVVAASLSVTITEASLQNVFPHLLGEYGDTGNASEITATSLGRKLLGRRLLLPCSLYFEWDEVSSHVVRLEMTVDFLTPISRVLGSITDAAFVLSQALITRDCAIGKFDM